MFSIFSKTLGRPRGAAFTIFVIFFFFFFFLNMNLTSFIKKLSTKSFHLVTHFFRHILMYNIDGKRGSCHLNSIFLLNIQMYTLSYQAPLIVSLTISYAPRRGQGVKLLSVNLITGCSGLNCTYFMP